MFCSIYNSSNCLIICNLKLQPWKSIQYVLWSSLQTSQDISSSYGETVGFSTFCTYRPANVVLSHNTPYDIYLCKTGEHFISLANALLPPSNWQWIQQNVVYSFSETCMLNQCDKWYFTEGCSGRSRKSIGEVQ